MSRALAALPFSTNPLASQRLAIVFRRMPTVMLAPDGTKREARNNEPVPMKKAQ
jgi:hypothetical protein